jgi:hypothetical protein
MKDLLTKNIERDSLIPCLGTNALTDNEFKKLA